uniref:Aspartyl-tRNA synthetase n=1 Tax=Ascaris suum TaxID=6253 RepID=F1L0R2_ASCSU
MLTQRLLRWSFGWPKQILHLRSATNDYTMRTHTCGELRIHHKGHTATIFGWLSFKRMNRFLVLRDAYGSVQVRIPESRKDLLEAADKANYESALKVTGVVADRGSNRNPNMKTGDIEIVVDDLEVLNNAPNQLPYSLRTESESIEETRLRYRYLDLRSNRMQQALRLRSEVAHLMRKFLIEIANFVEVETPTLFRRTPGGASEFIVPAPKPNLGKFYSLPQSPQQFKQLLMCGGLDRYYQIARCYRDEGSKLDRQPEFTQVDVELSFTTQNDVMQLIEDLIIQSWPKELKNMMPSAPFKRLSFAEAYRLYGIDKPDLRIPWTIVDCTERLMFLNSSNVEKFVARLFIGKGLAKRITRANRAEWKRLIEMNIKGQKFGIFTTSQKAWFKQISNAQLMEEYHIEEEDAVVVSWGDDKGVQWTLGQLRHLIAEKAGLRATPRFDFVWITDFPLFIRNDDGQLESAHHPFTAPIPEHERLIFEPDQIENITAQHYDLVLNGVELGGGSIRIHNANVQRYVIERILGESAENLNHLLEALSFGAPPHGGFALGLDRYIALLLGKGDSSVGIRDVIAFPKSKEGRDLMSDCPAEPLEEQLQRYGISVRRQAADKEKEVVAVGT